MGDKTILDLKKTLYLKIKTTDDVTRLRHSLEKCDKRSVLSWVDENGYDILHHSILSNNIEAVGIIFALGLFKPPHEPKSHPYIHVAANLGHRAIVAMLLQERPRDYSRKKTKYKWIKNPTEVPLSSRDNSSFVTSLDVAGDSGHVGVVTTILDFYAGMNHIESGSENHLCIACASNSPSALRLLLKQNRSPDDVKAAVGSALKLANAECLDVLLRCNPNLTTLFRGMNLYHVLYSYSMSFNKEWYESLLTITSVLLKHKQNPASAIPFRTYPLYSLLGHTPPQDLSRTSQYIVACVVLLLNAGVDPNFDELTLEAEHQSLNIQAAFGRRGFSSAFHCLFATIDVYLTRFQDDIVNIRRHLTKCIEILLRHSADPNIIGPIGDDGDTSGTALHAFMKCAFALGLDERSIVAFRLLIQNGTDPDRCVNGAFPINTFCHQVLLRHEEFDKIRQREESSLIDHTREITLTLLNNMAPECIKEAVKVEYDGKPTNELQRKLFKMIKHEVNKSASDVLTLKHLCRIVILQCCDRKSTVVVHLPIPTALKKFINSIE